MMKLNWGTSIVLAFAGFIVFILFFVVKTFTQKELSYQMVSKEYYKEELAFQKTINAAHHKHELIEKVGVKDSKELVEIILPKQGGQKIKGVIHFYRPDNSLLDFEKNIDDFFVNCSKKNLIEGRWNIAITWSYNGTDKQYYYKEEFYF